MIGCSVLLLAVTLGVLFFLLLVTLMGPCSGDGGMPYARGGSDLARACADLDSPRVVWSVLLVPALLVVVGAILAWVRRSFVPLFAVWAVGLCLGGVLPLRVLWTDGSDQRAQAMHRAV